MLGEWVVVARGTQWVQVMPPVPGMAEAEMWRNLLAEEGIVALIQPNDASVYLGANSFCHVLVPAGEAARAADLIASWSDDVSTGENTQPAE